MTLLMQQERRLYPRYSVDFELNVTVDTPSSGKTELSARVANLSQNGVNIIFTDSDSDLMGIIDGLSYSDECELFFALTEGEETQCYRGRLTMKRRASQSQYSLGFHFLNMTTEQEQNLEEYLYLLRLNR